jgi:hypothetical protein
MACPPPKGQKLERVSAILYVSTIHHKPSHLRRNGPDPH